MAKAPPAFQFYVGDFLMGTAHLDAEAIGCYLLLLCFQWAHGFVPSDASKRARICRKSTSDFNPIWDELLDKFVEKQDGTYFNQRLETVRANQLALSEKRAKAGAKGGRSKAKAKLEQNASLQPSTFSLQTSPPSPPGGEAEVVEEISKRGVVRAKQAFMAARGNGCGLDQIRLALEYFDSKPGAWDGGALYEKLKGMRPEQLAGVGWPDPAEGYELDERRRQRDANYRKKQTKQQQEAAEREAARKREQELEQRHGAAVDSMDRAEAERILRERLGTEAAVPFIKKWARGSPIDGMGRWELILALEEAESVCRVH